MHLQLSQRIIFTLCMYGSWPMVVVRRRRCRRLLLLIHFANLILINYHTPHQFVHRMNVFFMCSAPSNAMYDKSLVCSFVENVIVCVCVCVWGKYSEFTKLKDSVQCLENNSNTEIVFRHIYPVLCHSFSFSLLAFSFNLSFVFSWHSIYCLSHDLLNIFLLGIYLN